MCLAACDASKETLASAYAKRGRMRCLGAAKRVAQRHAFRCCRQLIANLGGGSSFGVPHDNSQAFTASWLIVRPASMSAMPSAVASWSSSKLSAWEFTQSNYHNTRPPGHTGPTPTPLRPHGVMEEREPTHAPARMAWRRSAGFQSPPRRLQTGPLGPEALRRDP